jgi:hypothetical protein
MTGCGARRRIVGGRPPATARMRRVKVGASMVYASERVVQAVIRGIVRARETVPGRPGRVP